MTGDIGRRVVVTGSSGLIGSVLSTHLSSEFDLFGVDVSPGENTAFVADICDTERLTQICSEVRADAVIHLAGDPRVHAGWESLIERNIRGSISVFEAAQASSVRRVVVASSNHVSGGFEHEHAPELYDLLGSNAVTVDEPIRPDSPYGVSKAFAEALARYFFEFFGIASVCLRIGSVLASDDPWQAALEGGKTSEEVADRYRRLRTTWLSHRDCASLFASALRADLGFGVFFGVSANSGRFWDIEQTQRVLGWRPVDGITDAVSDTPCDLG